MFRYWWEEEMSWKDILKYCEYHRNPPEPIPAKEEEKMAGAITTATPNITRVAYSQRRKKRGKENEEE